jgi:hypothetical protein
MFFAGQALYDAIVRASHDPFQAPLYRPFDYRTRLVPLLDALPGPRRRRFIRLTEPLAALAASFRPVRRSPHRACCAY